MFVALPMSLICIMEICNEVHSFIWTSEGFDQLVLNFLISIQLEMEEDRAD